MTKAVFGYMAEGGVRKEGVITLEDYRTAADLGVSVTQLINQKYPDADRANYGTAFEQGMQSVGVYTRSCPEQGIKVSNVKDILDGSVMARRAQMAGEGLTGSGGIVAPSSQGTTPASRIFFPEVVLQIMNEVLQDDYSIEQKAWANMVGSRESIPTEMFTQPLINIEAPKAEDSAPIAQNSLPRNLVSITTSQTSKSIRVNSVGLQISDQAISHVSIDLIGTIFAQQARGESIRNLWRDIAAIKTGNLDAGESALTTNAFTTFDAGAAAGTVTQLGWLTYLFQPGREMSIDSIICDLPTYLQIQNRVGRPVIFDPNTGGSNTGNAGTYGLNVDANVLNVSIGVPNVLIVPTTVLGANIIMGFDSRFGVREVTNISAAYSATEKMVLQRSNFFRMDWGKLAYRLFDSAFSVTDIT